MAFMYREVEIGSIGRQRIFDNGHVAGLDSVGLNLVVALSDSSAIQRANFDVVRRTVDGRSACSRSVVQLRSNMRVKEQGDGRRFSFVAFNPERDIHGVLTVIACSGHDVPCTDRCACGRLVQQIVIGPQTGLLDLVYENQLIFTCRQGHLDTLVNNAAFI